MKRILKNKTGFTLIEVMLVIGIVALLASLAIPQMLRSRMHANETAAIGAMRTVANACQAYYNDLIPHTYPANLRALIATSPPYVDSVVANATARARLKQGYYFTYRRVDAEHFTLIGWPGYYGRTGTRNFFSNETGVITYTNLNGIAPDENSPIIQ